MRILVDGQTLSTPEVYRGIGEYLMSVLGNIKPADPGLEVFIAAFDDYDRESIESIRRDVRVVSIGRSLPAADPLAFTIAVVDAIKKYGIDVFWIPNPLMLNVNLIADDVPCPVVATVQDLIPLRLPGLYLDEWPEGPAAEYRDRISRLGKITDAIISASESTTKDTVELLGLDPSKIRTVHHGPKQFRCTAPDLSEKYGYKYIMYVGGFDPRKNMENAVLAFKKLLEKNVPGDLKLLLVCSCDAATEKAFSEKIENAGLAGRVSLTGFIPDGELLWLYDHATALFFPSLYEGFGLPVLDAMSRGLPVAAAGRSSIPEIVGDAGILFDPDDVEAMANALYVLTTDEGTRVTLIRRSRERAADFSWDRSVREHVRIFRETAHLRREEPTAGKVPRIAFFTPVSPQKTGVALYSEELLMHLKNYAAIDLFLDDGIVPWKPEILENFRYYSFREYPELLAKEKYDATIYQMGNNVIHRYIYDTLLRYPGITVLHDSVIHPFIQYITVLDGDPDGYLREMSYAYGAEGEKIARAVIEHRGCALDLEKYPLNERVIKSSRKTIAHSYYAKYRSPLFRDIRVIPQGLAADDNMSGMVDSYMAQLKLTGKYPILGCFGFMNPNKRIDVVLKAFKNIRRRYKDAVLLIVGEVYDGGRDISAAFEKDGMEDSVVVTGFCDEDRFNQYMACTDIVINLRYPTMGETSRTLLNSLALGKPTIVSDVGSYREYPDRCCWKVDVDPTEVDLLTAYLTRLIEDKGLRETMGQNARDYIDKNNRWEIVARGYMSVIRETLKGS